MSNSLLFHIFIILSFSICNLKAETDYCAIECDGFIGQHTLCKLNKGPDEICNNYKDAKPDAKFIDYLLINHNHIRDEMAGTSKISNMQQLSWDDELAEMAQRIADLCTKEDDTCHDFNETRTVGQNIVQLKYLEKNDMDVDDMMDDWTKEIKEATEYEETYYGYLANIVGPETKYLGCGRSIFDIDVDGQLETMERLVCHYSPNGNVDTYLGNQGEPCSNCMEGMACGEIFTNLCVVLDSTEITTIDSSFVTESSTTQKKASAHASTAPRAIATTTRTSNLLRKLKYPILRPALFTTSKSRFFRINRPTIAASRKDKYYQQHIYLNEEDIEAFTNLTYQIFKNASKLGDKLILVNVINSITYGKLPYVKYFNRTVFNRRKPEQEIKLINSAVTIFEPQSTTKHHIINENIDNVTKKEQNMIRVGVWKDGFCRCNEKHGLTSGKEYTIPLEAFLETKGGYSHENFNDFDRPNFYVLFNYEKTDNEPSTIILPRPYKNGDVCACSYKYYLTNAASYRNIYHFLILFCQNFVIYFICQ